MKTQRKAPRKAAQLLASGREEGSIKIVHVGVKRLCCVYQYLGSGTQSNFEISQKVLK